jgi:ABC-type spermidine/putrescine transport system permease subunit II
MFLRPVTGIILLFNLYVFRTSKETCLMTSTALKQMAFRFNMLMMFVPHLKHISPQLVTGITLLFNMYMIFVPHSKHIIKGYGFTPVRSAHYNVLIFNVLLP